MQAHPASAETHKGESRRRHLVTGARTLNASPYVTASSRTTKPATTLTRPSASLAKHSTPAQQSAPARRETAPVLTTTTAAAASSLSANTNGREPSRSRTVSARPSSQPTPAAQPPLSLHASSRASAPTTRVPTLSMSDLTAAPPRSTAALREATGRSATTLSPSSNTAKKTSSAAAAAVPEQATMRVGALIVRRSTPSPRLEGSALGEGSSSVPSPYTASPVGSPLLSHVSPFGANALTVHEPCDLFDLHHALQHRLVEELGWSLHWYLDTETEIHELELARELNEAKINGKEAQEKVNSSADGAATAVTPRHSDPNTPQKSRVDAAGRQLPYAKQKSQFGVMSARIECGLCHELASVRRSAFALTPRSRLSRSPYEFRLASLRRWLRKRAAESAGDALLAACLSDVVQRYLAYVGFADCWTSLFVTAGLPVLAPVASTTSPTASREKALRFPVTLSSPARFDRLPLSFYVLPALCRWTVVEPAKVERLLRTSAPHPFPLSACFPELKKAEAANNAAAAATATAAAEPAVAASALTFFCLQRQSHLPDKRRSSSRRSQMASLGEACACDVYLVTSSTAATDAGCTGPAAATVWGFVQPSSGAAAARDADGVPLGELFYIAGSLENYLRLGLVFGWVYGWQLCYSTVGPPPNSVPWLRWLNASAYEAAVAANTDQRP